MSDKNPEDMTVYELRERLDFVSRLNADFSFKVRQVLVECIKRLMDITFEGKGEIDVQRLHKEPINPRELHGWISVKDCLPNPFRPVLVIDEFKYVWIAKRVHPSWVFMSPDSDLRNANYKITHWMKIEDLEFPPEEKL